MTQPAGMLPAPALAELVKTSEIDTVLAVFTDLYGRFMGKRFDAGFFVEQVASGGTHACNYLLTVDMEMEPVPGYKFANWQKGYGDFHLVPDVGPRRGAWGLERTAVLLCAVEHESAPEPVAQAPRSILKKQIAAAAAMGFRAMAGSELEYYLFQNSYRDAATRNYSGLEPAGWYIEDYHALQGTREEPFNGAGGR